MRSMYLSSFFIHRPNRYIFLIGFQKIMKIFKSTRFISKTLNKPNGYLNGIMIGKQDGFHLIAFLFPDYFSDGNFNR